MTKNIDTNMSNSNRSSNHDDKYDMEDATGSNMDPDPSERVASAPVIAKQENQAVRGLRLVVALVLGLSMTAVSVAVHQYIKHSEEDTFKEAFEQEATKVLESLGYHMYSTMGALDGFASTLVSYAQGTEQTWPFVTIPDVYLHIRKTMSAADVLLISVFPRVEAEQRAEWEAYSIAHDEWVDKSLDLMEGDVHYHGPVIREYNVTGTIYGNLGDIPYDTTRALYPSWMTGPTIPIWPPYNWDTYSVDYNADAIDRTMEQFAVISPPYMVPDPNNPDDVLNAEYSADYFKDFVNPGEDPMEPASDINYPIIDQLDAVSPGGSTNRKATTVGLVTATWYWRDTLKNILPVGSNGIVIVFQNPCGSNFTYEINGPDVRYVGYGDMHDHGYDGLSFSSSLYDLDAFSQRESSYTGVPIDKSYCPFTVSVYASSQKKAAYTTDDRVIFAVAALGIFVFVTFVFIAYDVMVERRQNKVMTTAVQSATVVSQLFPSNVRDRLYDNVNKQEQKDGAFKVSSKKAPKDFEQNGTPSSSPIADLFPDTTVYFADIAGFTKWSSTRQPTEVFTLLETLYACFDAVARRRGVFKVETIGDCYLAVCGLPNPNKRHAEIMVRFAAECLEKMSVLTAELAETLGPDTIDLNLRAGCHSGPTTAGVLRGEKSRFQLFGDTVNTASRMESTGEPGKIQVSETTAQLLRQAGKAQWLKSREVQIEAKGKGKMQTYWCLPNSRALTSGTSGTTGVGDASNCSDEYVNPVDEWLAQQTESQRSPAGRLAPPADNDSLPTKLDVDC